MPMTALRRLLASLFTIVALTSTALAQSSCTTTSTDLVFGNVDVLGGGAADITGTITVTCNILLNTLGTRSLTVRLGPGSGGTNGVIRRMTDPATGSTLEYQLYRDAARTLVFGDLGGVGGAGITFSGASFLSLGGVTVIPITVYGRVSPNQGSVTPGSYTSAFQPPLDIRIDYEICSLLLLCSTGTIGEPFTVTAQVQPNCLVAATAMNFGNSGVLSAAIDAVSQINVKCTANSPFQIGLGDGLHNDAPLARRMRSTAGDFIGYELYRDSGRTLPWGPTGSGSSQAGTGSGTDQAFAVFGRVPAQATPPAGSYSDTVSVVVTY